MIKAIGVSALITDLNVEQFEQLSFKISFWFNLFSILINIIQN